MPSDRSDDAVAARRALEAELVAERTATDHWRRLARKRAADYAALRRRPFVRAVLAIERRLLPLQRIGAGARARFRAACDRLLLRGSVLAIAARRRRVRSREDLVAAVRRLPVPPAPVHRITLVAVGALADAGRRSVAHQADVEVVTVDSASDPVGAVSDAIEAASGDVIGILLATTEPLDASWLTRLAAAVTDGVVAAAPVLVHPTRPWMEATPHDGLVRAAGLAIEATDAGVPYVRAIAPGSAPDVGRLDAEVSAVPAACIVVDRAACHAAGGLPRADDIDVAVIEMCARLRERGGRIVVIPSVAMVDARPVSSLRALTGEIDAGGRAWRAAIDRSGPALLREAKPLPRGTMRFALTVAAPSSKVAPRWGDWHLAEGLAAALRRCGHEVVVQTADHADDPATRTRDVHVVLRGLEPVRRSPGQRHVLWIISHPESIENDELDAADLVLSASPRFADHLPSRTTTPVEVLLQATDHYRFFPRAVDPAFHHQVTVVAKTRDVLRPVVADALRAGLRPAIYGNGWQDLVDPQLVKATHIDNDVVPVVYSSADVVLNDHWRTMQTWGFVSNRLYDVLACGVPVISDPVEGIADLFDGAVLEYRTPAELRALVHQVRADPATARERAARGRAAVLAAHTFDHRADELLAALERRNLV